MLVLSVPVGDAGYRDPAGNAVPETQFEGTGPALLFHDGRLVKGTWSKKALDSSLTLKTAAGDSWRSRPAGSGSSCSRRPPADSPTRRRTQS